MKSREENLLIGKQVYKEIMAVIEKWQSNPDNEIYCCWDECLHINDDFFYYIDLQHE